MKRCLCVVLVLLLGILCLGCADDSNMTPTEATKPMLSEEEKAEFREYFRELARNYKTGEDGTTVTVTAPDFAALIRLLPEDSDSAVVTAAQLKSLAAENPELVKEYVLTVESVSEQNVYKALYDTLTVELFISIVGDMELDFSDPAQRGEAAQ